jgi:hypothetical protein
MRFIITSTTDEKGANDEVPMTDDLFKAYMKYNEDLHRAGVLVASEGLLPGAGLRVVASRGKRVVVDGPFAESKEPVGGFHLDRGRLLGGGQGVGVALPRRNGVGERAHGSTAHGRRGHPAEVPRPRGVGGAGVDGVADQTLTRRGIAPAAPRVRRRRLARHFLRMNAPTWLA